MPARLSIGNFCCERSIGDGNQVGGRGRGGSAERVSLSVIFSNKGELPAIVEYREDS